jgi:putative Mn2+ efflux pump MntP
MFEVIISVLCVSIDGFFTGSAIGLKNTKIKLNKLIIIGIIPIIMAYPVMFFGNKISNIITNDIIKIIGFSLFLIMSINSFIEVKKEKEIQDIDLINSISIGISLGLDSSVCAFTLALEKYNPFITPIYFGISHFILIWLGNILFNKKLNNKYIKYLSPITFLILAILRLF